MKQRSTKILALLLAAAMTVGSPAAAFSVCAEDWASADEIAGFEGEDEAVNEEGAVSTEESEVFSEASEAVEAADGFFDYEEEMESVDIAAEDGEILETQPTMAGIGEVTDYVDGTYVPDEFTAPQGKKVTITCPSIVIENGIIYGNIHFSSSNYTQLKVNDVVYTPVSTEEGSLFKVPVVLNEDMVITGTTIAMSSPHDINYTIKITLDTTQIPVKPQEIYDSTIELPVSNSVKMFKVSAAALHTVGTPGSDNYQEILQLTMGSSSFDKVFVGTQEEAAAAENTIAITDCKAEIDVKDNLEKNVIMSFYSVKNKAWYERVFNISKTGKTLTISPTVPATNLTLDSTEKTVSAGDTFDLTATIEPKDSTDKVTWSSNKETVATVDANGKVTAVKCGTAIITAKAGEYTAQCKVVVSHKEEVLPEVAPTCTKNGWTAGKKCSVCGLILSARKLVKATGHKEEVIPAVEATPGHTGLTEGKKCSVCGEILVAQEVIPALPETAVSVSKITLSANTSTKIAAGKKVQLTAAVAPENAENKAVTWKSSNKKVATVNANGVVTMKKNAGGKTVVITATAKDGSKVYGSIKLTCMKGTVKKITISGKKTVKAGKTLKLKANVTASSKANKNVVWSSSNTKVAAVSAKGVVKGKKKGTVTITARSLDGTNKKATIKIKVK